MRLNDMISVLESIQHEKGVDKDVWLCADDNGTYNISDIEEFKNSLMWIQTEDLRVTEKDKIIAKFDQLIEMIRALK